MVNLKEHRPKEQEWHAEWSGPAKGYPIAETFAGLAHGVKRKRNSFLVHMENTGEAGEMKCAVCGLLLKDPYPVNRGEEPSAQDRYSVWEVLPKRRVAVGAHYYCSWGAIMRKILEMSH